MPQIKQNKNSSFGGSQGDVRYDPSRYTLRTKNFLPYYEKVLQLLNLYDDYENLFIDTELKKKLSELNSKYSAQFREINENIKELNAELVSASKKSKKELQNKLEKLNNRWYSISPEYAELSAQIYRKRKLCEKAFLIKNGKHLLDCWFEDCDVVINENADEKEVNGYMSFLLKIWADFFLKYRKLTE